MNALKKKDSDQLKYAGVLWDPESMWIYYNRKPVTVSKSQPLCLSLRGKYSKYLTIKNSSSREIVYSTGHPRSSLDREKRAEGSHTCKTHEPLSIYPEGSPACALICRLAALLDCWRLEGSHWICWSPRKTGQMRCVCWFNGIPRGSVPHASPHLWASGLRGYCCPASSGFNVRDSVCVQAEVCCLNSRLYARHTPADVCHMYGFRLAY